MHKIINPELQELTQEYLAKIDYPTYFLNSGSWIFQQAYRNYYTYCNDQSCVIEVVSYITTLGEAEYFECSREQLDLLKEMLQAAKKIEFKEE